MMYIIVGKKQEQINSCYRLRDVCVLWCKRVVYNNHAFYALCGDSELLENSLQTENEWIVTLPGLWKLMIN